MLSDFDCPSTIRISVPNLNDGQVIEITVQERGRFEGENSKQNGVKWKSRGFKRQQVTCTLQCWSRRHPNTFFVRMDAGDGESSYPLSSISLLLDLEAVRSPLLRKK
ncbi:uncharacterized protein LOC9307308 isoform X2 [Arabidopsis lyrata subsp. lyrata]|uniref:uncharacterized protein LOC9307308 isoform X2 n=1 Tax=Arabidopsis lyrata subsp. lyrata TaxID=81972 RepID=UPI000A29C28C|nr:uncharacterized protein LOC9307308 isoform X2 [Arabidopsis lyrata subsp. lyrata]|eukprot:XP_002871238.2 uncharacterized protein LOC9307308 isoform X2 [Arabidopsis lyrata subsp. lyrata]